MSDKEDKENVQKILEGDVDVFKVIMDTYTPPFKRYIRRFGIQSPRDEDILQEVFLTIYKNLNTYNQEYKFSSWAYRITHNKSISELRKTKNEYFLTEDEKEGIWNAFLLEDDTLSEILEKEYEEESKKQKEKLSTIVRKLKKEYYDVIMLYYFEQRTYDEISDILRIPTSTVGTRLRRAKQKLYTVLKEKD